MNVMMQEMTWQDFNEKKNNAVAILPVGSTEQHGPMLPLSVDAIISTGLAKMVAEKVMALFFRVLHTDINQLHYPVVDQHSQGQLT